jgi:DnaJ-class molecular chaperone
MTEAFECMLNDLLTTCVCGADFDNFEGCANDEDGGDHGAVVTESDLEWKICTRCKGNGWLRGYPGVFTQEDFETTEDIEDYLNHMRECEDCAGSGKVHEISEAALARPEVAEWVRDFYDTAAIEAAERRAGA